MFWQLQEYILTCTKNYMSTEIASYTSSVFYETAWLQLLTPHKSFQIKKKKKKKEFPLKFLPLFSEPVSAGTMQTF